MSGLESVGAPLLGGVASGGRGLPVAVSAANLTSLGADGGGVGLDDKAAGLAPTVAGVGAPNGEVVEGVDADVLLEKTDLGVALPEADDGALAGVDTNVEAVLLAVMVVGEAD